MFNKDTLVPIWFIIVLTVITYVSIGIITALVTVPKLTTHLHPEDYSIKTAQAIEPYERVFYQTSDTLEKVIIVDRKEDEPAISDDFKKDFSYAIVHSGAKISNETSNGTSVSNCTMTVITPKYGITSGHCAETGELITGYSKYGRKAEIGIVVEDYMPENQDNIPNNNLVDVALIKFHDNIKGAQDSIFNEYPRKGSSVSILGHRSKGSQGHVVETKDPNQRQRNIILTDALVRPGDSGGPVYDSKGNIIGIVEYSYNTGESGITPIVDVCNTIVRVSCDNYTIANQENNSGILLK